MHIRYILIPVLIYFSARVFAQEIKHRAPVAKPHKVAIVRPDIKDTAK